MGLDGGTIISRSDVIRGSSWRVASSDAGHTSTRGGQVGTGYVPSRETASESDLAAARWSTCAMTGEILREPIVACGLGKLYNRESVLEFLLGKGNVFLEESSKWRFANQQQFKVEFQHIRSMKDVFQLHMSTAGEASSSDGTPKAWVCPLTSVSAGQRHGFSALMGCGHAFSTRALREVTEGSAGACPLCSSAYDEIDVVILNASEAQMEEQRGLLAKRKKCRASGKAHKKQKLKQLEEAQLLPY